MKDILSFKETEVAPLVEFDRRNDKLVELDLTAKNETLSFKNYCDTKCFSDWINNQIAASKGNYGIGGYNENRVIYNRSSHFVSEGELRSLHLGVDIWAPAGTKVFCPLAGLVHSFKFNSNFGDYGATIILQHQIGSSTFHTLYGHLSLSSIAHLAEGQKFQPGDLLATFGQPEDNGNWPPHLHFQVIVDMEGFKGDYPGVCKYSERERYLQNCPDPNLILRKTFC